MYKLVNFLNSTSRIIFHQLSLSRLLTRGCKKKEIEILDVLFTPSCHLQYVVFLDFQLPQRVKPLLNVCIQNE